MALILYSLVVLWYDGEGHKHVRIPDRPWYRQKRDVSFQDMVTTLRRLSWEEKIAEVAQLCAATVSPDGSELRWDGV